MRNICFLFIAMVACVFIIACTPKINKPEWKFEKEAIRVHIKADHRLNLYNEKAHTLYMCFYQLDALNAFDQMTQDENGIRKLLEAKLFDFSVAAVSSKTILSGENITLSLDRAERAEYFAVVTGYYARLSNERMVRRHKFQVFKQRESLFKQIYQCSPCGLDIELILGPSQIVSSKIITNDKKCRNECE